ncbi:MAG TPA: IS91 family transposase [Bacteroidales bacterium]|nr:IS91 family transposase [Bacteroidales bacterium]
MTKTENKPHGFELGDILKEHALDFLSTHTLCPVQLKAMRDIMACRTNQMKGRLYQCNSCGYSEQSYNSCRNRHCNKCQLIRQSLWADKLKGKLIPGQYFHLVFTVPESLNKLIYINQQNCYSLLFKVAWSALNDLCNNPRFLGAQTGAVAVLHTWSSTMTYHPHVHMLVPAGGLSEDEMEWIRAKDGFLIPVKVLSKIYRARFCDKLKSMITNNVLTLPKGTNVNDLFKSLYRRQWIVYAKKTDKTVNHVLEYLARYTNRVAIGNNRITNITEGKVTLRYKDPKTGMYNRTMTLPVNEFIRRFMQHIVPIGFYKIRYFGIFATVNSKDKKEQCLALIGKQQPLSELDGLNDYEAFRHITGNDPLKCKKCKTGKMIPVLLLNTG